jgi:hypothetical protein
MAAGTVEMTGEETVPWLVPRPLALNEEVAAGRTARFDEACLPIHPLLTADLAKRAGTAEYGPTAGIPKLRAAAAGYSQHRNLPIRSRSLRTQKKSVAVSDPRCPRRCDRPPTSKSGELCRARRAAWSAYTVRAAARIVASGHQPGRRLSTGSQFRRADDRGRHAARAGVPEPGCRPDRVGHP